MEADGGDDEDEDEEPLDDEDEEIDETLDGGAQEPGAPD
jgi:hypothetical protein